MTRPQMNTMRMGLGAVLFTAMMTACDRAQDGNTASASLSTASAPNVGPYLTDAAGRAVYMFVLDDRNVSRCSGACAAAWPPLPPSSAAGDAKAAVRGEMIATITRSDRRPQVEYNGMPVYHYEDDEERGDIKGHGKNEFGGLWYLVSPNGNAIRPAAR